MQSTAKPAPLFTKFAQALADGLILPKCPGLVRPAAPAVLLSLNAGDYEAERPHEAGTRKSSKEDQVWKYAMISPNRYYP